MHAWHLLHTHVLLYGHILGQYTPYLRQRTVYRIMGISNPYALLPNCHITQEDTDYRTFSRHKIQQGKQHS